MKKRPFFWLLLVFLVSLSLACELINAAADPGPLRLESVDVAPTGENSKFTASVAMPAHTKDDNLICYTVAGDGTKKTLYDEQVSAKDTSAILTFDFTVTEPGSYKLYCYPRTTMHSVSTSFSVNLPLEEPPAGEPKGDGKTTKISGTGTMIYYSDEYSCSSPQDVILVVLPDGRAELHASGEDFVDHINCTKSGMIITYIFEGVADASAGTVAFTSCNSGGFDGKGGLTYKFDTLYLNGQASCWYIKGDSKGKIAVSLAVP
jgi:hypothetical protein